MGLSTWWGDTPMQPGDVRSWQIGSLGLVVRRGDEELVVAWSDSRDPVSDRLAIAQPTRLALDPPSVQALDEAGIEIPFPRRRGYAGPGQEP